MKVEIGNGEDANLWEMETIRLRFRLGSKTVWRPRLQFAVCHLHFTQIAGDARLIRPPFEKWGPEVQGALIVAHPVSVPLPRMEILDNAIRYVPWRMARYYLPIEGSFDQYLSRFSSKSRSTLKRKVRKFAERSGGKIDWREFGIGSDASEFHDLARSVAVNTYQETMLDAAIPADPEFASRMARDFAQGRARGWLLFLDNKAVAYLHAPIQDGAIIYEHVGYDPAVRDLSPGVVLQYLVLERLFTEGRLSYFDFTEGGGQNKETFGTESCEVSDLYFFRKSLAHLGLIGAHAATIDITRGASKVLGRLKARDRFRRFLRRARPTHENITPAPPKAGVDEPPGKETSGAVRPESGSGG